MHIVHDSILLKVQLVLNNWNRNGSFHPFSPRVSTRRKFPRYSEWDLEMGCHGYEASIHLMHTVIFASCERQDFGCQQSHSPFFLFHKLRVMSVDVDITTRKFSEPTPTYRNENWADWPICSVACTMNRETETKQTAGYRRGLRECQSSGCEDK